MTNPRCRNWIDELIARLGGPKRVGRAFDVTPQTVQNWRAAGKMPTDTPERVERIKLAARLSGISRERLAGLADDTFPDPEERPAELASVDRLGDSASTPDAVEERTEAVARIYAGRREGGWSRPSSRCGTNERPDLPVLLDDAA